MKKIRYLIAMGGAMLLLNACENDKYSEVLPVVKDSISFALDIQPILSAQCAGCHNPGNVAPDLRKGFAYESLTEDEESVIPGDAESSELMEMLERQSEDGNNMPPAAPLSPIQLALIKKWIDEGAKDN